MDQHVRDEITKVVREIGDLKFTGALPGEYDGDDRLQKLLRDTLIGTPAPLHNTYYYQVSAAIPGPSGPGFVSGVIKRITPLDGPAAMNQMVEIVAQQSRVKPSTVAIISVYPLGSGYESPLIIPS